MNHHRDFVVLLLLAGVLFGVSTTALGVVAADHTANNSSDVATDWVVWTNQTVLDTGVSSAAITNVDTDGEMHVAYAKSGTLYHSEVSLLGTKSASSTVSSGAESIESLQVVNPAPGVAHLVWRETGSVSDTVSFKYAVVTDGSLQTVGTLHTISNREHQAELQDVEVDEYGRSHVLLHREEEADGDSVDETLEMITLDTDGTQIQTLAIGSYEELQGRVTGDIAITDSEVIVLHSRTYGRDTRNGIERYTTLRAETYTNEPPGLTEQRSEELDAGVTESTEPIVVRETAIHPDGYVMADIGFHRWSDFPEETVILYDSDRGIINDRFLRGSYANPVWDDTGTLYARSDGKYVVTDKQGNRLRQATDFDGFQEWAINSEGYLSMLQVVDGTLTYRAQVTQAARSYPSVYERAESGTHAQQSVIEDLEARVANLQEKLNSTGSGITIDVTVKPTGSAYVEGGSASVQVESDDAPLEQISVQYMGSTYEVNESGQVVVPLKQAGTQELAVQYRDQTVTEELVVEQADGSESGQPVSSPSATGGTQILNILLPILAIMSLGLLGRYKK